MTEELDHATAISKAATEAATVLANATAEAAAALARATARAAASTDDERNRKIDVMYDRSERVEAALFGSGVEGRGLMSDVTSLKSRMNFVQWAGGIGTTLILGTLARVLIH